MKLMMNSEFGNSIENVRERRRVKIVKEPREALKLISHNCFKHFFPFNEKIAAIELFKTRQCLDKPIYVGLSILDISKLYMYNFHYQEVLTRYPNTELLFTDTDSFCYQIYCKDFYAELKNNIEWF